MTWYEIFAVVGTIVGVWLGACNVGVPVGRISAVAVMTTGVVLGSGGGQVGHTGMVSAGRLAMLGNAPVGAIFFAVPNTSTGREHAINTRAMIINDQVFDFILPSFSPKILK